MKHFHNIVISKLDCHSIFYYLFPCQESQSKDNESQGWIAWEVVIFLSIRILISPLLLLNYSQTLIWSSAVSKVIISKDIIFSALFINSALANGGPCSQSMKKVSLSPRRVVLQFLNFTSASRSQLRYDMTQEVPECFSKYFETQIHRQIGRSSC